MHFRIHNNWSAQAPGFSTCMGLPPVLQPGGGGGGSFDWFDHGRFRLSMMPLASVGRSTPAAEGGGWQLGIGLHMRLAGNWSPTRPHL